MKQIPKQSSLTTQISFQEQILIISGFILNPVSIWLSDIRRSFLGIKPTELLILLLAVLIIMLRIIRRDFSFSISRIDAAFLLIIFGGSLMPLIMLEWRNIYISKSAFQLLIQPTFYYIYYRVIVDCFPYLNIKKYLIWILLLSLAVPEFIGILQFIFYHKLTPLLAQYFDLSASKIYAYHRAVSIVGDWEAFGAISVYPVMIVWELFLSGNIKHLFGRYWKLVIFGTTAISLIAIVFSYSFTAIVGIITAIVLLFITRHKLSRNTIFAIVGIIGVAFIISIPILIRKFSESGNTLKLPGSWVARVLNWQIYLATTLSTFSKAIFGVQPDLIFPVSTLDSADSLYVLLVYRGGFIYLFLFVLFAFLVIYQLTVFRHKTTGIDSAFISIACQAFIINLVMSFFDPHFTYAAESHLILTLLGIATWIYVQSVQNNTHVSFSMIRKVPQLTRPIASVTIVLILGSGILGINAYIANKTLVTLPPMIQMPQIFTPSSTLSENKSIGTYSWYIDPGSDTNFIQGYAGSTTVLPGGILPLYISSASPASYRLDVYRMGWYHGWGGHLLRSETHLTSSSQGIWKPSKGLIGCTTCTRDSQTNLVETHWVSSLQIPISNSWVSGVYLIKLITTGSSTKGESYIPFVVKDASPKADFLINIPFNTYIADNLWGGYNLYQSGTTDSYSTTAQPDRAVAVSFDRPLVRSAGAGDFLNDDIYALRWIERSGMNVSYTTDSDLAAHPDQVLHYKGIILLGHDAYWTTQERTSLTNSLQHGIGIVALGAGNGHWQARYSGSAENPQTLITYKVSSTPANQSEDVARDPMYKTNPALITAAWRDPILNQPENALFGEMEAGQIANSHGSVWTASDQQPQNSILTYAKVAPSETITSKVVSGVIDSTDIPPPNFDQLIILGDAHVTIDTRNIQMTTTLYHPYNNVSVFDAGSLGWEQGLDEQDIPYADIPNSVLGNQSISNMTTMAIQTVFSISFDLTNVI